MIFGQPNWDLAPEHGKSYGFTDPFTEQSTYLPIVNHATFVWYGMFVYFRQELNLNR